MFSLGELFIKITKILTQLTVSSIWTFWPNYNSI